MKWFIAIQSQLALCVGSSPNFDKLIILLHKYRAANKLPVLGHCPTIVARCPSKSWRWLNISPYIFERSINDKLNTEVLTKRRKCPLLELIFAHPNDNVAKKVVFALQLGKFQTKKTDWKEEKGLSESKSRPTKICQFWSDARQNYLQPCRWPRQWLPWSLWRQVRYSCFGTGKDVVAAVLLRWVTIVKSEKRKTFFFCKIEHRNARNFSNSNREGFKMSPFLSHCLKQLNSVD